MEQAKAVRLVSSTLQNRYGRTRIEIPRGDMPRPYKCPICPKAFHRLEHQTRHIRTHTGEKPHACTFPRCIKRFSRSDELTRHLRIHNNPNSRRGRIRMYQTNKPHLYPHDNSRPSTLDAQMMPPPRSILSAPCSNIASPSGSPPSYHSLPYVSTAPRVGAYGLQANLTPPPNGPHGFVPTIPPRQGDNMTLLASAANRLEPDQSNNQFNRLPPLNFHFASMRAPSGSSLAQYSLSAQLMTRSSSLEGDSQYRHHPAKKSRPNSPFSTAPPSPTFSHDSLSPTPDPTPIITPAHSPCIPPLAMHDSQLPHIRHLSLHKPAPPLMPMEPSTDTSVVSQARPSTTSTGMRISDILSASTPSPTERKLPLPTFAVTDPWTGSSTRTAFNTSTGDW